MPVSNSAYLLYYWFMVSGMILAILNSYLLLDGYLSISRS